MRQGRTRFSLLALRKRNQTLSGIDAWGAMGLALAPLCTFLITPTPSHHGITVDRVPAVHATSMPGAMREDAMKIMIMMDGVIYFGNHRVTAEELPEEIRERVRNGAERKVYLVVDQRAKYSNAEKVLDQVRLAGIPEISILTGQPYIHK